MFLALGRGSALIGLAGQASLREISKSRIIYSDFRVVRTITSGRRRALSSEASPRSYDGPTQDREPPSPRYPISWPSRPGEEHITLEWPNSQTSRFEYIWLRDHCRCPSCFHQITKQRLVDTFAIPKDIKPFLVEHLKDGLKVTWPQDSATHESFYPYQWLYATSYSPPLKPVARHKIRWGSSIALSSELPRVDYDQVMQDDRGVYEWLTRIDRFGFSFVEGVPATPEATEELTRRIAFIKETQYGRFWDFTSDLAHGDTAYTSIALPAHTDTTYYADPCGLQVFHLLQPAPSGGTTLLVDGFNTAEVLRKNHPSAFEILSHVPVITHSAGDEETFYTVESGKPVISLDAEGEVEAVRWNNDDRSTMRDYGAGGVLKWYDALRAWNDILKAKDSEFWVPLKAGTAIAIDNHRVLHGRSEFSGPRRMCGAYIGHDEWKSRWRVLRGRYAPIARERQAEEGKRSVWSEGL